MKSLIEKIKDAYDDIKRDVKTYMFIMRFSRSHK